MYYFCVSDIANKYANMQMNATRIQIIKNHYYQNVCKIKFKKPMSQSSSEL